MPKSSKILLLAVSVALVLTVFLGVHTTGVSAASEQQDGAYRQINVYSEVLRHIQSDYVTDPDVPAVTNGALRGLLESLDADSSYLTPDDYKVYKAAKAKQAGKAQIGLSVSKRGNYAVVVSIVPGSPASRVTLSDGDFLEAIDGHDTRDLSLAMIEMMLSGEPGSPVSVSVVRQRSPVPEKLNLTRAVIQPPAVSDTLYENASILYLKPVTLDREHVAATEAKLRSAEKSGARKVLLDLRDVSGGDMAEASRLANFFLKSGTIATLEGQKIDKQTFSADPSKTIDPASPLVVLVNRGTAGPGELVAAALLDDKRAELVGERTFGEGSQQKLFELPDGSALILTTAKYSTPSGKKLQDDAVTPGVLVAGNNNDDQGSGSEDGDTTSTPAPAAKPSVQVDEQLTKGLDLLKAKSA